MHHGPRGRHEIWFADVVALFFILDRLHDELDQLSVRRSAAHQFVEVVVPYREQAGAQLAIGRDADAAAMAAEWMRHRGDDSDFSNIIGETVTARGLALLVFDFEPGGLFSQ